MLATVRVTPMPGTVTGRLEDENHEDVSDTEFHTPSESKESVLFSCYSGRCDEVQPTFMLSDFDVKLAHDVLTKGKFRNQKD